MSTISGFGGFAGLPALNPNLGAPAQGARPAGAWFDTAAAGHGASLRAEVEPGARGLGVQQHAERVLAQLLADPALAAGVSGPLR